MNNVVITSCRNEAPYLLEWISWNISIGFDKIIVYTNDNTDNTLDVLESLSKSKYVEYYELDPPENVSPQMYAFNKGLDWVHQNKPKWISCLDVDEFIVLHEDNNIQQYLDRFPDADAIAINWKIFGSSNIKAKGLGVTPERFFKCAKSEAVVNNAVKSIFKYRDDLVKFHHKGIYKKRSNDVLKYIYSDGHLMPEVVRAPGSVNNYIYISHELCQINHYAIRSLQELSQKMNRGNGFDKGLLGNPRISQYLKKFDKNSATDFSIIKHFPHYFEVLEDLRKYVK